MLGYMYDKINFWYDGKFISRKKARVRYEKEDHAISIKSGDDGFYTFSGFYVDKIYNLNIE